MRRAVDSSRGQQLFRQVESVLANLWHGKHLSCFYYRGQAKVRTQWSLCCMVAQHREAFESESGVQ